MTEKLPSRWEGVEKRVPESLDDLHGPADGILALPPHLCWSGMREFDLGNYQDRLMCYQIVLTTGRCCDAEDFVNADLWLAGGCAIRAHGLVERPSQDLDFATIHRTPLPVTADEVAASMTAAGFETKLLDLDLD